MKNTTGSCHSFEKGKPLVLTIDLKKRRLRLYKQTLCAIGDPEFIQFLVEPRTGRMVIKSSCEKARYSQRIYWTNLKDKGQCCEFYSKLLLDLIKINFFPADKVCTYRVYGSISGGKSMIMFNLNNIEPLNDEEAEI